MHMAEAVTITPGARFINGRQVPEIGTWTIDPSHAAFEFVARHLMAKVRGRFPDVSGEIHITEVPEESSLEIEINVWVPVIRSPHATCAYSWISPPSRSRRTMVPAGRTTADSPGPSGGTCPKARCGR